MRRLETTPAAAASGDPSRGPPWTLAVLAAAGLVSLATAVYVVGNGESATLQRSGRLAEGVLQPGLGLQIPWGVDRVTRVRTGEVLRAEVHGDQTKQLQRITGDENFIEMIRRRQRLTQHRGLPAPRRWINERCPRVVGQADRSRRA